MHLQCSLKGLTHKDMPYNKKIKILIFKKPNHPVFTICKLNLVRFFKYLSHQIGLETNSDIKI